MADDQVKLVTNEDMERAVGMIRNEMSLTRRSLLTKLLDTRRDINDECGYPVEITPSQYRILYDREGIATRVVKVYPEESWAMDPEVYETEDPDETEFEKAWKEVRDRLNIWHYMERADELSGIGRFGVILLGFDDGQDLNQEVQGDNLTLQYLRVFDESVVDIKSIDTDQTSPRYSLPTMYSIDFQDTTSSTTVSTSRTLDVHHSRIIHIADNKDVSEVYGVPRMQILFNRLYDLRKILGGSGEMFWKGAFPGYSVEVMPEMTGASLDTESLRQTMTDYMDGLQRYVAVEGVNVKSLTPQVADPSNHVNTQLKAIALALGIPQRILFGSEEAKLSSSQDMMTWNKRLKRRQEKYLSPMMIRPFVDRLIQYGALPEPAEYTVAWPDLNAPTDQDKAEVAKTLTEAMSKYVAGDVEMLIPPAEFLTHVVKLDQEVVETIMDAALRRAEEMDMGEDDETGDGIGGVAGEDGGGEG